MESWSSSVKSEESESFERYAHAKESLVEYIEVVYNRLQARPDQPGGVRATVDSCSVARRSAESDEAHRTIFVGNNVVRHHHAKL